MKIDFKKICGVLLTGVLIFSSVNTFTTNIIEAKGSTVKSSSIKSSSKPRTSSDSKNSKPKANTSSKPTTSTKRNFSKSSKGSYNHNYNSYNNQNYKKQYTDYLNNNYRSSGFFSGNSITNMLLWYTLFHHSTIPHTKVHASDQQKELVDNVKDSKVPVYMLEIKTKEGETKYISVTKEQYDKVKEGDNISLKSGHLEIKN
ncbi:hypothetical protein HMPREF1983_00299 [Gemella bergeri ATCC 700627]|uniref:Uncharacterized protein n=1 Tax=Gemella bergeri ATCC 700627 TaxID=1321820 RepID=U2S3A4_9BACL|nr:hypothetical protein [Gemella bergeri]ERK60198.1 hypothetical protein HMPREF1983_00299 [Gemella bergeri ATCC 700627]